MVTEVITKPKIIWQEIKVPLTLLIDLDGCVVEFDFPKIVWEKYHVRIKKEDMYAYDVPDTLGISHASADEMFREQIFGKPDFIDGALETLQEWEGKYEIIIFSNRVKYMGYEGLMDWLIDNQIPFNGIDGGQGVYDFHIDDKPSKLKDTHSKVKLLFDQPWNQKCHNIERDLKRVFTWDEIRREVDG